MRGLLKSPLLAAVAIVSLALGIGANVTVYSVVRELILDDVSAHRPDRLARVDGVDASYALYRGLRDAGAFQDLAFHRGLGDRVWQSGNRSELVWTFPTSANFFDVLGVRASAGRLYSQADEGRESAVVSYGFWRKRLAGEPRSIGGPLQLNGKLYTILGVLPRDYRSVYGRGVSPEIYLVDPVGANPQDCGCRLFGRLRDGFSRGQTSQALVAAAETLGGKELARRISGFEAMSGLAANASKTGGERLFFLFFVMLFGVSAMLALIACSNVAGLLLARASNRRRDLAIRKALGANRLQIARPLLAEALALVACGALAGLGLDAILRNRLGTVRWPTAYGVPVEFHFQSDGGLLLYALLSASAALLLSSLVPALGASDPDLGLAMKPGDPSFSIRRWNLRSGFVMVQVVLSVVLLALGAIFTRSFFHLARAGPGFDVAHTLIAAVHPLPVGYSPERSWDLRERAVRRVAAVPGVAAVTSAGILPLMGELPDAELRREGEPQSAIRHAYAVGAGERYCATLGIPILRGRDFRIADRGRKPLPVIVNRTLSREFFGDADPVGSRLLMGRESPALLEIVGVAADARMRTLGEGPVPLFFVPAFNAQLLVRVAGNAAQWIEPLRTALREVDPAAAVEVRPMEEAVAGALFPMRVAAAFVGALSGVGLMLTLVGLYASVSYAVSRRTRDFGIRAALGASRRDIVWTALGDALAVVTCGAFAGIPLAVAALRPLAGLLPEGVDPWEPACFAAVVLVLVGTGAAAAWIPSRRAGSVSPSIALRQE
ncbi:MAG TPA: FtsX-like permease family protein [Bryobacteraceae bacterium]|nr:FtsX-like permease family protein [Bryobacteraceae bacterium]